MDKTDANITKIIEAAKTGGAVLKNYFGKSLDTIQKTTVSDFKTKADIESEKAILNILTTAFPDYNIYSEEHGEINRSSDLTFFIDPLDGTNNFVLGIPNFSVSIGLFQKDEIIAGAIYHPIIDNIYWAERGKGAYFDGQKLQVNNESQIENATIGYLLNYEIDETKVITDVLAKNIKRIMVNWSPAFDFCMLASGKIEGIINQNTELYDFAAGKLIAKEAGALITDLNGNPESNDKNRIFLASNGTNILKHLVEVMNAA